jgi:NAD(P)-dependent dehydrogenase (short-subunit alcohol dehydrogenase family)
MAEDQYTPQDPQSQYPKPELKGGDQSHPGMTGKMPDRPDHGEETYRGSGRLTGRRAVITGGDSGIGRAVAVAFAREGADVLISYLPNTASVRAYQSSSTLLDYATTKGGIVAFTKALAEELAEKGIRVNAVAPGPIWTPLIPATMHEEKVKAFGSDTPLGRAGQPAELAPAYVYFASQESSYTTGEVLGVTGGKPVS